MRAVVLGVALALCGLVAGAGLGAPGASPPKYSCVGDQVTLINNTNGFAVDDGGTVPSFNTNGVAYCLTYIQTYHWNSGQGQLPGTLGLVRVNGPAGFAAKVGPFKAKSSAGQNNAPNVNWFVGVPPIPQNTIINGKYQCSDSGRSTWSSNKQSGGAGFCIVYAVKATPLTTTSGSTSTSTPATTTTPTTTTGKAKKCACKGIGVKAGALKVAGKTFTLTYGWTVSCTTGTGGCSGTVKAGTVKVLGGLTPAPKTTFKLVKKTTSYKCTSLCTTSHSGTATVKGSASRAFTELNGRFLAVTFTLKCGKKTSKVTLSYRITTKPPPKVKACKCSSVKVALAAKQKPIVASTFAVSFAWTLKCVPGKGLPCTGTFAVGAPVGVAGVVKKTATVKCSGNCGKTKKGTAKVTFIVADPKTLYGKTLAVPVTATCNGKKSTTTVKVAVGASGKLTAG